MENLVYQVLPGIQESSFAIYLCVLLDGKLPKFTKKTAVGVTAVGVTAAKYHTLTVERKEKNRYKISKTFKSPAKVTNGETMARKTAEKHCLMRIPN